MHTLLRNLLKLAKRPSTTSVSQPVEPSPPGEVTPPQPDMETVARLTNWYSETLSDIQAGKDLAIRRAEVMGSIEGVELRLAQAIREGTATEVWKTLKNELYYLIWQIEEQTGPGSRGE